MSWRYRTLVRPFLFAQDAEKVHERTMRALEFVSHRKPLCSALGSLFSSASLPVELFGLKFPNPVGLAAGMDKFATALPAWEALGFGFSELGAITLHAQPGNPAPRLFRAIAEGAIINRMGFNNPGAAAFAEKLAEWRNLGRWPKHPVGINLGKSKITPLDQAATDYAESFRLLRPYADFFVVNVSSPNTPGLRTLQDRKALEEILAAIEKVQSPKSEVPRRPILVKVAPDLSNDALDELLEVAAAAKLAGIVATNTTLSRPDTQDVALQKIYSEQGGLSGRPLTRRSTEVIRFIYRQTKGKLPIIGVGGIFTAADAWEKITSGASLVQVYTGLVYEGPGLASTILRGLCHRVQSAGLTRLEQAIGTAAV